MPRGVENDETMVIEGLVIPSGWDPKGKVTEAAILAYDDREFRVAPGLEAEDLRRNLRRSVRVRARPLPTDDGTHCIEVLDFEPIPRPRGTRFVDRTYKREKENTT